MKLSDLHKSFAKSVSDRVYTGNTISNGQISSCIRPHTLTECNGRTFNEGELRKFDLNGFKQCAIPSYIQTKIKSRPNEHLVLYFFRSWNKRKQVSIGWLLTNRDTTEVLALACGPRYTWLLDAIVFQLTHHKLSSRALALCSKLLAINNDSTLRRTAVSLRNAALEECANIDSIHSSIGELQKMLDEEGVRG